MFKNMLNLRKIMTDKELKKMSRADFLELLIEQSKEIEQLKAQLADTEEKLKNKETALNNAVPIMQSAFQINAEFDDVEVRSSQQLEKNAQLQEEQEKAALERERIVREKCIKMIEETQAKCKKMERATKDKCAELLKIARAQTEID